MIQGGAIPEAKLKATECLFEDNKICTSINGINIMKNFLNDLNYDTSELTNAEVVDLLKKELNVTSESNIWDHIRFKKYAGVSKSNFILKNYFKPPGPADSTALLDNYNIDNTLEQWSHNSQSLFGRKLYYIPFQMIDFAKMNTELSQIDLGEVINDGYDCLCVVLNTDISSGKGKHWFCLFCDFKHKDGDPYTIEYFNSSGNPPRTEVEIWMQKAVYDLKKKYSKKCIIIRSASRRLQYSQTECGVWSLMYIKSRLQGHNYNWFYKTDANDNDMIKLRKHLFRKKI